MSRFSLFSHGHYHFPFSQMSFFHVVSRVLCREGFQPVKRCRNGVTATLSRVRRFSRGLFAACPGRLCVMGRLSASLRFSPSLLSPQGFESYVYFVQTSQTTILCHTSSKRTEPPVRCGLFLAVSCLLCTSVCACVRPSAPSAPVCLQCAVCYVLYVFFGCYMLSLFLFWAVFFPQREINSMACSSLFSLVATGDENGLITLWDQQAFCLVSSLTLHQSEVTALCFLVSIFWMLLRLSYSFFSFYTGTLSSLGLVRRVW